MCSESASIFWIDTVCCVEVFSSRTHPSVNHPLLLFCTGNAWLQHHDPLQVPDFYFDKASTPCHQNYYFMTISITVFMTTSATHNAVLTQKSISIIQACNGICIFCTVKFIKSFLPFQKLFTFCCSTECQWATICRPCYKICVGFFCATFGFVLLSRREDKLSIKTWSDHFRLFVWKLYLLYFVCIGYSKWFDSKQ